MHRGSQWPHNNSKCVLSQSFKQSNLLTREQCITLEEAASIERQQLEAVWQYELTGWALLTAVLTITGEDHSTLIGEGLSDALVPHGQ